MPLSLNDRQQELLDGLVALFVAEGFRRFTLGDLTVRLRCSKSTLYALGESKEQLVGNAVVHFFRTATAEVERRTALETDPAARVQAYLTAVADALRPASPAFIEDVAAHPAARQAYARNTRIAARRVRELIDEGVASGAFRAVHAAFVADTVAATMARIQSGDVQRATGLRDAEAYEELATLVLRGVRS
ncbi:TetR/AcrR family transcriptional regulator [Patulibacter sp. S7RM1-6]